MAPSVMQNAFAHHAWANDQLLKSCAELSDEQLAAAVPGTYGSILATLRHLVHSDVEYLFIASTDWWEAPPDTTEMSLADLRDVAQRAADGWAAMLETGFDPAAIKREVDENDGYQRDAPLSIWLPAALHHGNEHRTQVCTAFSVLGLPAPKLGVWQFAVE